MALTGGSGGGPRSSCPGAAWNPGFTTRLSPEGSFGSEVSACSRHGQFLLLRPLGVNPHPLPPSRRASEASAEWTTPELALRPGGSTGHVLRRLACAWTAGGSSPELRPRGRPPKPPPGSGSGCRLCPGREREPAQKEGDPTRPPAHWSGPHHRCRCVPTPGAKDGAGPVPSRMDGRTPVVLWHEPHVGNTLGKSTCRLWDAREAGDGASWRRPRSPSPQRRLLSVSSLLCLLCTWWRREDGLQAWPRV